MFSWAERENAASAIIAQMVKENFRLFIGMVY